jgi:hypothetical protein
MQNLGYEFPRIPVPRTWVNKGKKRRATAARPRPPLSYQTVLYVGLASSECSWEEESMTPSCCIMPKAS